jgi:hypothetical protein
MFDSCGHRRVELQDPRLPVGCDSARRT